MQIATQIQHRALAFIEACGKAGYRPTKGEIELWLKDPEAEGPFHRLRLSLSWAAEPEDHLEHIERLGWIGAKDGRLELTTLGRALLISAERAEVTEGDANAVILDSGDPFAYAKLIGHLASAEKGLLVDPYFRLDQLMTILSGTSIVEILISKQHKNSTQHRAELKIALDSPSLPRTIEVRASDDRALHDRLIVGERGEVWTLGASLNSVGSVNTVLTPVPDAGAVALREQANRLWEKAELVGPTPKTDDDPTG